MADSNGKVKVVNQLHRKAGPLLPLFPAVITLVQLGLIKAAGSHLGLFGIALFLLNLGMVYLIQNVSRPQLARAQSAVETATIDSILCKLPMRPYPSYGED
ncbi:MAG: hypothetical protein ACOX37_02905 [Bacillota bacterium]